MISHNRLKVTPHGNWSNGFLLGRKKPFLAINFFWGKRSESINVGVLLTSLDILMNVRFLFTSPGISNKRVRKYMKFNYHTPLWGSGQDKGLMQ